MTFLIISYHSFFLNEVLVQLSFPLMVSIIWKQMNHKGGEKEILI